MISAQYSSRIGIGYCTPSHFGVSRIRHRSFVTGGDHYRTDGHIPLRYRRMRARLRRHCSSMKEAGGRRCTRGHDLGHTPFGPCGKRALNEICPYGFKHNEQSVRTVELLEKDGDRLNLHMGGARWNAQSSDIEYASDALEGKVVRFQTRLHIRYREHGRCSQSRDFEGA